MKIKRKSIILISLLIFVFFLSNYTIPRSNYYIHTSELKQKQDSLEATLPIGSNNPPDIPLLNYPLNESLDSSNIVTFDWEPIRKPTDNIFYEFILDNDTDFTSPEAARFAINNWSNSTMEEEPCTTFLAYFEDTYQSEEAEDPIVSLGTSFKPGKFGNGIFLNASAKSNLTYNATGNLSEERGTIEFWVKLEEDLEDIDDYLVMFDYTFNLSPYSKIVILINNDTNRVFAMSQIEDQYYPLLPSKETPWKKNEWHHVCLTWGDEMARLFLDGIEEGKSTYFPFVEGDDEIFTIGSVKGTGLWINATFDEVRLSSIQRYPLGKSIWNLNESKYTHMFEQDGTYYWKVRAHNMSGPSEWSETRIITINRELNQKNSFSIEILDKDGIPISNVNVSYNQNTLNNLMGIDANFGLELINSGVKYYHQGEEIELYKFFGKLGTNSFRTRLWMDENSPNSLENAIKIAKWAQNNGSRPYLTIFLSDDWSDTTKQPLPIRFQGLTFEQRLAEIEEYSKNVTDTFKKEGIDLEFYEIGNEIDYGICGIHAFSNNLTWLRENVWYNESRIINASINGVRQIDPDAQFMLHIGCQDVIFATAFYTAMKDFGVPYDIIGMSYYPAASGDAFENMFKETIKFLSTSGLPGSDKIIIPETSYSSQLNGGTYPFDEWNNSITEFPLTPEGQKDWTLDILEWCYQNPNIIGINYWTPELYYPIWGGFSWFNETGHSKVVVDAYPEFYDLRKVSLSEWKLSNEEGTVLGEAYRGKLSLIIQYNNHIEYYNISISPFRSNNFIINLSISITPNNDDGDDDDDDDNKQSVIPGFPLYLLIGISWMGIVFIILRNKAKRRYIFK